MSDQQQHFQSRLAPVKRSQMLMALNTSIDGSTLQRRRSMNTSMIKPVLEQKRNHSMEKTSNSITVQNNGSAAGLLEQTRFTALGSDKSGSRTTLLKERKQIYSSQRHANKDLMTLNERPRAAFGVGRPPRSNVTRRQTNDGVNPRRKKEAIASLLKDRVMATELIRLYTNSIELHQSQKKLSAATKHP